jgi:hypothetical protein
MLTHERGQMRALDVRRRGTPDDLTSKIKRLGHGYLL